jgi:peroxiredoxin
MSGDQLIRVGDLAPGFTLAASDDRTYDLKTVLSDTHVVLIFYPGNNTPG